MLLTPVFLLVVADLLQPPGGLGASSRPLDVARAHVLAGAPAQAIALARAATLETPENHEAWSVLAWACATTGDEATAEAALTKALALAPPRLAAGTSLFAERVRAQIEFREHAGRAAAASAAGDIAAAAEAHAAAWRCDPTAASHLLEALRGLAAGNMGDRQAELLSQWELESSCRELADVDGLAEALDAAAKARAEVDARRPSERGVLISGMRGGTFGVRPGGRLRLGRLELGVATAVEEGLQWLEAHQDQDGRLSAEAFHAHCPGTACGHAGSPYRDVLVTSLAALAMLGEGTTLRAGKQRTALRRAMAWLVRQQDDAGVIGRRDHPAWMHDHALATLALVEAAALSPAPWLMPATRRALEFTCGHRLPSGAWPGPEDSGGDLAATTWSWLALFTAAEFRLVDKEQAKPDVLLGWLDQNFDAARHWQVPAAPPRPPDATVEIAAAMTLISALARGESLTPRCARVLDPAKMGRVDDPFSLWLASLALYQAGWEGNGEPWKAWSKRLRRVAGERSKNGHEAGSWVPTGLLAPELGRVGATAVRLLALQSFYRYARKPGAKPGTRGKR